MCDLSLPFLLSALAKIAVAIRSASGPLTRTIPTPPSPAGVATAAIVSSLYIEKRVHLSNSDFEGNINPSAFKRIQVIGKFGQKSVNLTNRYHQLFTINDSVRTLRSATSPGEIIESGFNSCSCRMSTVKVSSFECTHHWEAQDHIQTLTLTLRTVKLLVATPALISHCSIKRYILRRATPYHSHLLTVRGTYDKP